MCAKCALYDMFYTVLFCFSDFWGRARYVRICRDSGSSEPALRLEDLGRVPWQERRARELREEVERAQRAQQETAELRILA